MDENMRTMSSREIDDIKKTEVYDARENERFAKYSSVFGAYRKIE